MARRRHPNSSEQQRREFGRYVWGALQVGGGNEFLYADRADKDMSGVFLEQIAARDPQAYTS